MEEVSGGRMHYMFNRVGGLKEDLPAGWLGRARATPSATSAGGCPTSTTLVRGNEIFRARTRGVGVLTREQVAARTACPGPIARASGRRLRPAPRRALPRLRRAGRRARGSSPATAGDCLARFECLLEQVYVSLDLADACLDRLAACPPGRSTGCPRC